jgi:hypothetical protein
LSLLLLFTFAAKQRKIRFVDDDKDNDDDEKDTRLKYKHPVNPVSALQAKMLRLAGQEVPGGEKKVEVSQELDIL